MSARVVLPAESGEVFGTAAREAMVELELQLHLDLHYFLPSAVTVELERPVGLAEQVASVRPLVGREPMAALGVVTLVVSEDPGWLPVERRSVVVQEEMVVVVDPAVAITLALLGRAGLFLLNGSSGRPGDRDQHLSIFF